MFNRKSRRPDLIPQAREKIAFGQLVLAGAFILLSFSSCQVAASNRKLARRQITNVQLADGSAILVEQQDEHYRDPKLLAEFTSQWVSLLFSWDGQQSGTDKPDDGVKTSSGTRVPLNAWVASTMMEPTFGNDFLNEFATMKVGDDKLIPPEVFSGRYSSAAVVRYLSEPVPTSPTTWRLDLVADHILYDRVDRRQVRINTFNKTLTLRAVAVPSSPLKENASVLEKTLYAMRSAGLEIVDLVDFNGTL